MNSLLGGIVSRFPSRFQQALKRHHFGRQIRRGRFDSPEPEFARLDHWVGAGDCALDIGANVGHYTARLSHLVGPQGRVIAFEPIPASFELLAANMARIGASNVTLLNAAASAESAWLTMRIPKQAGGADNYYMAHVTGRGDGIRVLGLALDSLALPRPVRLIKVDVEGHELSAIGGMRKLLLRDKPVLIVEGRSAAVTDTLTDLGYGTRELPGSPNRIFEATESRERAAHARERRP